MNSRIATLVAVAAFAAGVAVPGGGSARADDSARVNPTTAPQPVAAAVTGTVQTRAWDPAAMDEMHSAMAARMPDEARAACDEMHQAMAGRGGGSAGMPGMAPGVHASHHGGRPDV